MADLEYRRANLAEAIETLEGIVRHTLPTSLNFSNLVARLRSMYNRMEKELGVRLVRIV